MWFDIAVYLAGCMTGGILTFGLLAVMHWNRAIDEIPHSWVAPHEVAQRVSQAYDDGYDACASKYHAAKREAGLKAAETRKRKQGAV